MAVELVILLVALNAFNLDLNRDSESFERCFFEIRGEVDL
jgi:hypothetical protein